MREAERARSAVPDARGAYPRLEVSCAAVALGRDAEAAGGAEAGLGALMQPCTLWFKRDVREDVWEYNHLEDGHAQTRVPSPKTPGQAGWKGGLWQRSHAWLTDDLPARVVHYGPDDA